MANAHYLYAVVLVVLLLASIEAKTFLQIDDFNDNPSPLILMSPENEGPAHGVMYYWWSPYDLEHAPVATYQNYNGALGGQRDLVLGWEGLTEAGTLASISISGGSAAISFQDGFFGGAYFQWDGADFQGLNAPVFPGAVLNRLPGIGAYANTGYPEQNSDGISVDFTSGGNATGIYIEVLSDRSVGYFLDAVDTIGQITSRTFDAPASSTFTSFFFPYTDIDFFSGWNNPYFDWEHVAAFQVRVWTYKGYISVLESSFASLKTFGYVITGNVQQLDCDSEESSSEVENVQIDIFASSVPTSLLASTFTDVNGDFSFTGSYLVDQTSYLVCVHDLGAPLCSPFSGCFTVILENFQDPAKLQYYLSV